MWRERCALLVALALGGDIAAAEQAPRFESDILPILNSNCVMCHMPGAAQAELSLYPDAWQSLVGQPSTQSALQRVKPGEPDASYLMHKLRGTHVAAGGTGASMPFQRDPLDAADIERIRLWIQSGAKRD